jgi:ABC-type Fe3+-siderophore transport system permease subunit
MEGSSMTSHGGYAADTSDRYALQAGRFWASGIAAAVVAALTAMLGILVARGLFHVPVLTPRSHGVWGDARTATFAVGAAVVTLLAAGLMHVLTVAVAEPRQFFRWIMALLTLIAVITPLTLSHHTGSKIATALINLAVGAVITAVVDSITAATRRPAPSPRRVVRPG